jgi:hypothetical protein
MTLRLAADRFPEFERALQQASHGSLSAEIIESGVTILPIGAFT